MGEFPPGPFTPQGASRFPRSLLQRRCCCKRSRRASRSCTSNNPPGNSAAGLWTLSSKSFYHAEKVCSLAECSAYPGEEGARGEAPTVCQLLCWAPLPQAIGTRVHTSWYTGALPFNDEATWPKASFPLRKRRGNESFAKHRTPIILLTHLKGTCESFQFYLAASCCDSESKQEQRA